MRGRISVAGVAAAAVATALAGCAASSGSSAEGEADPGLAPFYDQALVWAPCEDGAAGECATLVVPLDYAAPEGERIDMALYRLPAAGDAAGSVVLLPGGPGGSGADLLGPRSAFRELARDRHVVTYDARGIGATSSFICESEAEASARLALDGTPDTPEEEAALVASWEAVADGCEEAAGPMLGHAGTSDLVRDLDVLRAALGEDALTFYGLSYGTLVGSEYVRAFPDKVGRAVLDAPVTARDWTAEDDLAIFAGTFEATLDQALGECFANPLLDCPLGATTAEARAGVEELLAGLDAEPVDLGARGLLTRERAVGIMVSALPYGPDGWSPLVIALGRAAGGSWGDLAALDPGFDPAGFAANLAVTCADRGDRDIGPDAVRADAADLGARYPVFGETFAWSRLICTTWPVGPTLEVVTEPVETDGAVLVVTSTGDPLTPASFTEAMAEQMAGATILTYTGPEHVAYVASDCARFAVNDFLTEGVLPESATCGAFPTR